MMSGYAIPTSATKITPEERQKRLGRVYAWLIDLGQQDGAVAEADPRDVPELRSEVGLCQTNRTTTLAI
jgi:hypothetical protein